MPILNAILPELDIEAKTTVRVLERIPGDRLDFTPHPKSSTLGKLAWHIASIPANVQKFMRLGTFDMTQARPQPMPSDTQGIVDAFKQNMADTRAYLETLTDENLREPFTMTRGEQTVLTIPKVAVVRTILMNHSYHHRGQLAVYLRLLDVPVPAIYGTSADEAM
ncbi:MAG TPA: DinB family protein [Thermoanaerobaculia bacterium]|nr:DinB family protein [Thermoanaerobaculia bacterium]